MLPSIPGTQLWNIRSGHNNVSIQTSDSWFNVWKYIIWSKLLSIGGIRRHRGRLTDSVHSPPHPSCEG